MKRIIDLVVDVQKKNYNTVFLKQMDTTIINVKILNNNEELDLSSQTVDILFTKPDDTIVQQLSTNIQSNNATIPLLPDCLRQAGQAKMEIEIKNTYSEIVSSFYIPIQIEKTSKENVTSDNTPNYFEEFAKAIENFTENSNQMLSDITEAEKIRKTNEVNRTTAEGTRSTAETQRVNTENTRKNAETQRINAENTRKSAETQRIAAENARNTAEEKRVSAEAERVAKFNEIISVIDIQEIQNMKTMLIEAIGPIRTEDGIDIVTENGELLVTGL